MPDGSFWSVRSWSLTYVRVLRCQADVRTGSEYSEVSISIPM
jgi:hypothetical protein